MAIQQVDMKEKLHKLFGRLLEYKDIQRGGWLCWDWLDCLAGLIGCVIGGGIHFALTEHW